jgi:chromosome segregation ATPase
MLLFWQGPGFSDIQHSWPYLLVGAFAAALLKFVVSPLATKIYEYWTKQKETLRIDSQALELSRDQELYRIREELRSEVVALRGAKEQIWLEKLDLSHQLDLRDDKIAEQEDQIKKMADYARDLEVEISSWQEKTEIAENRVRALERERGRQPWQVEGKDGK